MARGGRGRPPPRPLGTVQGLITSGGRALLGRLRYTWTVCDKGFTEKNRGCTCRELISPYVDVTVFGKVTPVILHGIVSPDGIPRKSCQKSIAPEGSRFQRSTAAYERF